MTNLGSGWSLEKGYDLYPRIEEEINAALDESLDPAGPDQLYDIVAELGLPGGAAVLDVGCGEGGHTIELARKFGFTVTGIDPVPRHIEVAEQEAQNDPGVTFVLGSAEAIPAGDASFELVWCRDVLVHVRDLRSAYNEMARVLKPGGRAVVYQMFATDLLEPREADLLTRGLGFLADSDMARTDAAIAAAKLDVERIADIGSEWGEWAQERTGAPGRKLLRAARLRRSASVYIERYGPEVYDMVMADCLWHVYAMIGKLTRRAYVLAKP